ncbi:MAG: DUF3530 family protein [Ectothiorhodospiraceae bacterium]|nr:DUF3530 family protein [Ectothiorhodospiraceae bacterium]
MSVSYYRRRAWRTKTLIAIGLAITLAGWPIFITAATYEASMFNDPTEPDAAFEQRWREQLTDSVTVGKLILLKTKMSKFVAIESHAKNHAKNDRQRQAVLILHDMRGHPDWQNVIGPLRRNLPELGWSTLSLQMPVLGVDTGMRDHSILLNFSPERITAGIAHLQQQGYKRIVILGGGLGSIMAASYLQENPNTPIEAFVGVSMYQLNYTDPRMWIVDTLAKLTLPILDIYSSDDRYGSQYSAKGRREAGAAAENAQYTQMMIDGTDHDFTGKESILIDDIAKWLNKR